MPFGVFQIHFWRQFFQRVKILTFLSKSWKIRGCKDPIFFLYGCFLKWWYPQNTPKWSFLVGKPMVVGYHHFRNPPYLFLLICCTRKSPCSSLPAVQATYFCSTDRFHLHQELEANLQQDWGRRLKKQDRWNNARCPTWPIHKKPWQCCEGDLFKDGVNLTPNFEEGGTVTSKLGA